MKKLSKLTIALLLASSAVFANTNKVYVTVNGEDITAQTIAVALKNPQVQFDVLPANVQKNILDQLVEKKLLEQHAVKDKKITSNKFFKDTLRDMKQSLAFQIWQQEEAKKVKISEDELKEYYEKSKIEFEASHILLEDEKSAKEVIATLKKSKNLKADFPKLAKEKSVGPSKVDGGSLGKFNYHMMVPEFSAATDKLKVGTISSKPVKSKFGYHVIYLQAKKSVPVLDFKQAKNQLRQQVGQKKLAAMMEEASAKLKSKAKIIYK
jgi:parvulin-like peptidyl-prolyl isomerase